MTLARAAALAAAIMITSPSALADFTLSFDSSDFGVTSNFNQVTHFSFEIALAAELVAGGVYVNPALHSVNYVINGVLNDPTPSGFPGFALVRAIDGADFYALSPNAALSFSILAGADLADGLQISELGGGPSVFSFNARELNQAPGRYHPPLLTLFDDGTGQLLNADNMSSVPNPPPPVGSGLLVDVDFGEEYDVALSFAPDLLLAAPVPLPAAWLLLGVPAVLVARRRRGVREA